MEMMVPNFGVETEGTAGFGKDPLPAIPIEGSGNISRKREEEI